MTFTVQYDYYIKNSKFPSRYSRFIELLKWNMTDAKNKPMSLHGPSVVKIVITGHK